MKENYRRVVRMEQKHKTNKKKQYETKGERGRSKKAKLTEFPAIPHTKHVFNIILPLYEFLENVFSESRSWP